MDAERFDTLVKEFSRRRVIKGIGAALVGAIGGAVARREVVQAQSLAEYALLLGICNPAAPAPAIPFPCAFVECAPNATGGFNYRPVLRGSETVCAAASGPCENDVVCDGQSPNCPAKTFKSANHVCDAASGPCERDALCDGSSASCPAKTLKPAGEVCRPARSACDPEDVCSGTSAACPESAAKVCPGRTTCCQRQESLFYGRCALRLVCAIVRRPKSWLTSESKDGVKGRDKGNGRKRSATRRSHNRRRKSHRGASRR